jgi:UDP-N-acetylmuramoyl-tripeptide--D-alanyl-D-alanine ligase
LQASPAEHIEKEAAIGLDAGFVAEATAGKLEVKEVSFPFTGVDTDSRSISKGELFVALSGENFDGHDFVRAALERGAAGVMAQESRVRDCLPICHERERALVAVPDTISALGDLARAWRVKLNPKVVAITGSSGKTTCRDMLAAILARRFSVLVPVANFNNLIGLPLTLLRLRAHHRVAVLELGMNRSGEIARLTEICRPDVALITNVAPAHLEFLGTVEDVTRAKGELFSAMPDGSVAVVNLDDARVSDLARDLSNPRVSYGLAANEAEVRGGGVSFEDVKGMRFTLDIKGDNREVSIGAFGRHNVQNAVAAAAAAFAMGASPEEIAAGLAGYRPVSMRLNHKISPGGINILDDTYNANPASVKAAVDALAALKGGARAVVALGDMRELGGESEELHREVGRYIANSGANVLYAVGEFARATVDGAREAGMAEDKAMVCDGHEPIADALKKIVQKGDWVLVKGSRLAYMENVVSLLLDQPEGGA